MLSAHDRRFREIVGVYLERPGGDYAELLWRGQVTSPAGVDPEAWRADIRAKARADKVRVATRRDGETAIAFINRRREISDEELRREFRRSTALQEIRSRAAALGHSNGFWLREDRESVWFCDTCYARIYVRFDPGEVVVDGEAVAERCS